MDKIKTAVFSERQR